MVLAARLSRIKPSPTLAVTAKAIKMKSEGVDVISLGAGEPDFDTPQNIKDAAVVAIANGETKYTAVDGTKALKTAIRDKFKRDNNLLYQLDEITVGTGGKQVLFNLLMASVNAGDEVIIPAPYWVSYIDIVNLAQGVPVIVTPNEDCKITPEKLEAAITNKTKWFILNSPSNPSGVAYSKEELLAFAAVLKRYPHVWILSDDIYEHVIFDGFVTHNIAELSPDLKDRVFIVNGVSKTYSMTGWRIGYGAGDQKLIKAMSMLQSQSTSNPSSISQAAAVEALNGTQHFIAENNDLFVKRRDMVLSLLQQIDGIECLKPQGAFYLFPSIKNLLGKSYRGRLIDNCTVFSELLLDVVHVAVVPGIAFGMEGYFRISYATSDENLQNACARIADFVSQLN